MQKLVALISRWLQSSNFIVGIFGVLISGMVAYVQFGTNSREAAKETQRFWKDFRNVVKTTSDHAGKLGESIISYIVTIENLLDAYDYNYRKGNRDSLKTDARYLAAYAKFIQEHANLIGLINVATIDYDFLRLEYASVASELKIFGWRDFYLQAEQVRSWRVNFESRIQTLYIKVHKQIDTFGAADDVRSDVKKFASDVKNITDSSAPHLLGLQRMLERNLEKYEKELR